MIFELKTLAFFLTSAKTPLSRTAKVGWTTLDLARQALSSSAHGLNLPSAFDLVATFLHGKASQGTKQLTRLRQGCGNVLRPSRIDL